MATTDRRQPPNLARATTGFPVDVIAQALVSFPVPPRGEPLFPIVPPRCYRCVGQGLPGLLADCDGHREPT